MFEVLLIVLFFLFLFSIIDIKYKAIPSIALTSILFFVLVFYFENLKFGLLSLILAYLLYEAEFFKGIADIKTMSFVGLFCSNFVILSIYFMLILVYGMIWKVSYKYIFNKYVTEENEIPFIPVFLFCMITLWVLGKIQ
jgi:hypothetical protein